ncbi:MAG: GatB/YqeY domain-containing protein [Bdellovibrionales bacterium]|nr:GatB/YqeY domain-containing protein [Bdellovibrionales bacterium]
MASPLKDKLSTSMKEAMKSGDKARLGFARNLHAAVRKKEIDDRVDLDDAGVIKLAQNLSKQRQDSIDQFRQGGRMDLVEAEEAELKFLQEFLPQQMSDDELKKLVEEAFTEAQPASAKEMGKVMKVLLPKIQGRADGKRVNEAVKARMGG